MTAINIQNNLSKKLIKFILILFLFCCQGNTISDSQQKNENSSQQTEQNSSQQTEQNSSQQAQQNPPKEKPLIYFIGNSLTYVHDIPDKLMKFLKHNELSVAGYNGSIETLKGAASLSESAIHSYIPNLFLKLPKYVVLQDQSGGLSSNNSYKSLPYYINPAAEVNAKIIFYQTWVSYNPEGDCDLHVGINNGKLQTESAPQLYIKAAREYKVSMAPVAEAFRLACHSSLEKSVVPKEDHHQLINGAYAAAYTFGYTLFPQNKELKVLNDSSVSSSDMKKLNLAALQAVTNQKESKLKKIGVVNDAIGGNVETAKLIPTSKDDNFQIEDILNYGDVDMFYFEATDTPIKLKIEFLAELKYLRDSYHINGELFVFDDAGEMIFNSFDKNLKFELTTKNKKIYMALIESSTIIRSSNPDYKDYNNKKNKGYTLKVTKF